MSEKQNILSPYAVEEEDIANLTPDPAGEIVLTVKDGLLTYPYEGKILTCALLVLGTDVTDGVDRTPLKAFKKMGKLALYSVPESGTPIPTKTINFDNFVSGIASHPNSLISAQGQFSVQGHPIPFTTACPTGKVDHGHVIIAANDKFQKSMDNIMHISGNEDAENLLSELAGTDLSYFGDRTAFAKKDIRVREFQQVATGETAIRKDILMFKPFKKFLPVIGMHLSPLRNTKQTRDLTFLMAARSLLGRKEITVHGDSVSTYPGVISGLEQSANVVLKFSVPAQTDEFKYLIRYFQYRMKQGKPFCMRLQLSPQVTWNKIHKKLPYLSYFRTGYLAGPYFGVSWNGNNVETPSPFTKMSILLSTETQIARYYIAKDVLHKDVSCKFTKCVMAFSICTAQEGSKRMYLPLEDFVLNNNDQPEIEMANDYDFDTPDHIEKPHVKKEQQKTKIVLETGPVSLTTSQKPLPIPKFDFGAKQTTFGGVDSGFLDGKTEEVVEQTDLSDDDEVVDYTPKE